MGESEKHAGGSHNVAPGAVQRFSPSSDASDSMCDESFRRLQEYLVYGFHAGGLSSFIGVLLVGQRLASGERHVPPLTVLLVLISMTLTRVLRLVSIPVARGVLMSTKASSVFVSVAMTIATTFVPAVKHRILELVGSFTIDVTAKWLMMMVKVKARLARKVEMSSLWQLATRTYNNAIFDVGIDTGADTYIAMLLTGVRRFDDYLYWVYALRAVRNIFWIFAACSEIGRIDDEIAAKKRCTAS